MEQVARRCIAAAAIGLTGLTMGGAVIGLTQLTSALPDVQVRDFGLAASLQAPDLQIETVENHIRPDLVGGADVNQAPNGLADLLFDRGDGTLNGITDPTSNASDLTAVENDLTNLIGGGLDPDAIRQGLLVDPVAIDAGAPNISGAGGAVAANDTSSIANAASSAVASVNGLVQGLPVAQEAFNSGVAAAEMQFNGMLSDAQASAVERFGTDSNAAELVSWMFSVNNSVLMQNENQLNNLLGINLDASAIQSSLVTQFAPSTAATEDAWNALLSMNPDEYSEVIAAIQSSSFSVLLGNLDWSALFPGLF